LGRWGEVVHYFDCQIAPIEFQTDWRAMDKSSETNRTDGAKSSFSGTKILVLVSLVAVVSVSYWQLGSRLSLESITDQNRLLQQYKQQHPLFVYAIATLIYVMVTGLSLPGAAVMTLFYGWYLGLVPGFLIVSFASTAGASLAFLVSRYLFRDAIRNQFAAHADRFHESLEKEGPIFLFTLRLVPAIPFFVINAVMGLTPIKLKTFWWVSQLGMLPGTLVYIYAGSSVPSLEALAENGIYAAFSASQMARILAALVLLGIFPLFARYLLARLLPKKTKGQE
jgi:uncharacterized membrane protein YdjX (TVP38/TMEM64 family)